MSDGKADYSEISKVYDAARTPDRPHVKWWLKKLAEAGGLAPGKSLLDLGCGTGRWIIPLAERTGCAAVGVDNSREMLAKARVKDSRGRVEWVLGDVLAPPVAQASFDCALMSLMLHHLDEPVVAFRAVFAALRPGGILLVRQGTLDDIIDDPAHRFFPEAVTIDRKRTPLRIEVEAWLADAGFSEVTSDTARMRTHDSPWDWLLEVEPKVCSVFRLMSDAAHARGLARLREHIEAHPDDRWLVEESMTLFRARKATCSLA
ncbi:MAG: class I SAM-dependent methyltransferase [Armatimonadota bacterium]|nr:MAG: class I SAM-dependent methyltransferase [Armatimonadota bacterium]